MSIRVNKMKKWEMKMKNGKMEKWEISPYLAHTTTYKIYIHLLLSKTICDQMEKEILRKVQQNFNRWAAADRRKTE